MSELAAAVHAAEGPRPVGLRRFAASFDEARFRRELDERGLRFVARSADGFPPMLRAIHDPPPGLFVRGEADVGILGGPAVAVVGARACSGYGAEVARRLGRDLAAAGVAVVSGLARGVDARAHEGALEADGVTVAVLGCGIDRDYPAAHRDLAARIARRGLIVSEYAPGVEPAPWRFPARNRIIAGLAVATVVVEARARSGALITADFAMEEGREVFAVPGEITSSLSDGANALLRAGAEPLCAVSDVLESLGLEAAARTAASDPLLDLLPATADELVRAAGRAAGELAARLAELELEGAVTVVDGVYRREV